VTTVPDEAVAGDAPAPARRAPVILYTMAFILLVAALGSLLLAVRGFLQELWPLWLSAGLSVTAILAALTGMRTVRRR
jgi:uncharacterized membrane protein YfcA